MKGFEKFTSAIKSLLPAPFTIAVVLTLVAFALAFFFTLQANTSVWAHGFGLMESWESGLWERGLLVFAFQMMLMLVLGHALALSKPIDRLITLLTRHCTNTSKAAAIVTFFTLLVSFFNWGLGLIFGAIFARKVAEYARTQGLAINYPIIGAAGYSGLMIWHGGLSGSSLIKAAEPAHLKELMTGVFTSAELEKLPDAISFEATVFSSMNLTVLAILVLLLPLCMYWVGKKTPATPIDLPEETSEKVESSKVFGAEALDRSKVLALFFSGILLFTAFYKAVFQSSAISLAFITPNYINLVLLGLGVLMHGSFSNFLDAVSSAISGASGILIQFPLYFGIMGIMKGSGLIHEISSFFIGISNPTTYPAFTFLSAGLVNIFVPSGGGQWMVQGPILIQAATALDLPLPKSILALAYGDQLTNMLQPFWALPLLGITGLKAKDIMPYTLLLMGLGTLVFLAALFLF